MAFMFHLPRSLFILILLVAAPTIAHAQQNPDACPQGLEEGQEILLERGKSRFVSRFWRKGDLLVEEREQVRMGRKETVHSTFRHALLPDSRKAGGREIKISFDDPVKMIKELPFQKLWLSEMTLTMGGREVGKGVERLEYRGKKLLNIGKCHYMTWVVRAITTVRGHDPIYFTKFYSPDLGLVIKSHKINSEGSILSGVEFDKISTRPAK